MSRRFRRNRDSSDLIKSVGIHALSLIVFFSVFVANVKPETGELVLNLAAGMVCALLLFASYKRMPLSGFGLILPFMLLIGWALFQCVNLPIGLVGGINPAAVEIWHTNPLPIVSEKSSVPINLAATTGLGKVQIYWVASVMMIAACSLVSNSRDFEKLGRNIVMIGIATSLLALAQQLFGNGKIYWRFKDLHLGRGGPFLNYSNMAQFLIIAIGMGMMMLLNRWHMSHGQGEKSRHSFRSRFLSGISKMKFSTLTMTLFLSSLLAILLSTGRMALVSVIAAYVITLAALSRNRSMKNINLRFAAVSLIILFILLLTLDISGRFASLDRSASRLLREDQMITITEIIKAHPLTGIGVGALKYVYPYYNEFQLPKGRAVAESDVWYFQLVAEIGLIGMLLVGVILIQGGVYLLRLSRDSSRKMMAFGYLFMIAGLSLGFATDFGLQRPAIFIPLAISFGVLKSLSSRDTEKEKASNLRRWGQILMLLGLFSISIITAIDKYKSWKASGYWQRMAHLEKKYEQEKDVNSKGRLLTRALELGEMAMAADQRDVSKILDWLELKIRARATMLQGGDRIGMEELKRLQSIARQSATAAPAYYKPISIYAAFLILGTDQLTKARELLEAANRNNSQDRLTLIRLSYVLILQGEEALAKSSLRKLMAMDSGPRVTDLLLDLKKEALLLDLLEEASLNDIHYAHQRISKQSPEHEHLQRISNIYVIKYEKNSDQKREIIYSIHLRQVGRLQDALANLNIAIRKETRVQAAKRWRLYRINLYEEIRELDVQLFREKYLDDYRSELRKLIRVFPDRRILKKKLAES